MHVHRLAAVVGFIVWLNGLPAFAQHKPSARDSTVAVEQDQSRDRRLGPLRTLRDDYHPWQPAATLAAWEREREQIRRQVLVAAGLWPLPEKTPLEPVIHGLVDRGDYTVERVFFASWTGLYVAGSLYRPKGNPGAKHPGVLCPHGHWKDGRFYDAGDKTASENIARGGETFEAAAHHPLQARMVQLARMGCVVFHYDMIGYADNGPLDHRTGFCDARSELWSQNILGLQTWNSIRALDFLTSLTDVDASRIGVTGASGGGTQTFLLAAVDPRVTLAFPAVMVSTAMQGGCVCENASGLRIGINNVAIAALCAPRPMAMSGADDWTIDIETKGLPELKQVYSLYGEPELVAAKCFPQFPHNYNQVSRQMMEEWVNRHFKLGLESPIVERDFQPLSVEEMTVYTAEHPRPAGSLPAEALRARLTAESEEWFAGLLRGAKTDPAEYRRIVGGALRAFFGEWPSSDDVESREITRRDDGEFGVCGRTGAGERIPYRLWTPQKPKSLVVWIDGNGIDALSGEEGAPSKTVASLVKRGMAVVTADLFLTGSMAGMGVDRPVDEKFPGYTFCYNRPLLAERVRDLLTVTQLALDRTGVKQAHFVGTGGAGPWVLLARSLGGDQVGRTIADLDDFTFAAIESAQDPNLLPGAMKFGGLGGLAAARAPASGPARSIHLFGCSERTRAELDPLRELHPDVSVSAGVLPWVDVAGWVSGE